MSVLFCVWIVPAAICVAAQFIPALGRVVSRLIGIEK